MNVCQIREATLQDLEAVRAVFSQADDLHRRAHPEIFRQVEDPTYQEYLLDCILATDGLILIAEREGQIVGALNARVCQTSDSPALVKRTYLSVDNLVVSEDCRQQGVGQALMQHLHEWAQQHALDSIYLTVWDFNRTAQAFYEKLGYQMIRQRMRKELP